MKVFDFKTPGNFIEYLDWVVENFDKDKFLEIFDKFCVSIINKPEISTMCEAANYLKEHDKITFNIMVKELKKLRYQEQICW